MEEKKDSRCYVCGSELIEKGEHKDDDGRVSSYKECPTCGHEEHWYD